MCSLILYALSICAYCVGGRQPDLNVGSVLLCRNFGAKSAANVDGGEENSNIEHIPGRKLCDA